MASTMYGADVAELRALSDRITRSADDLDRIARLLTNQITTATAWTGPNAQRFRGQWAGAHRGSIGSSVRALREGAAALRHNADQQASASAVDGFSATRSTGGEFGGSRSGAPTTAPSFSDWVRDAALPQLQGTYDLLTTGQASVDLLRALKVMKEAKGATGALPWMGLLGAGYELAADGSQTLADLTSGNPWRVSQAVFRTGWTVAKIVPVVGLGDTALKVGLFTGKVLMDGILGPGTTDRAFQDVGQQLDKAGNDVARDLGAAVDRAANDAGNRLRNFFHF